MGDRPGVVNNTADISGGDISPEGQLALAHVFFFKKRFQVMADMGGKGIGLALIIPGDLDILTPLVI